MNLKLLVFLTISHFITRSVNFLVSLVSRFFGQAVARTAFTRLIDLPLSDVEKPTETMTALHHYGLHRTSFASARALFPVKRGRRTLKCECANHTCDDHGASTVTYHRVRLDTNEFVAC